MALLERLNTDRSIAPLVAQFVPLKVDTETDAWQTWARKHPADVSGIPVLYVVRADGEMLYGKSGGKSGNELPLFLREYLLKSGKIFSDPQLATIKAAVDGANEAIAAGDQWTAVKRLEGLRKFGTPGKLNSYATVAVEADELYAKLVEEGTAALKTAQEALAGNDPFAGILGIVSANRIYGSLPELKKELATAERDLKKSAEHKALVEAAEALDSALARAEQKNATTRKSGISALGLVVTRYPGTPAASLAEAKLGELGEEVPAAGSTLPLEPSPTEAVTRIWTDASGKFRVEAELVGITGGKVQLKKTDDGAVIAVPLDKLSEDDRAFLSKR